MDIRIFYNADVEERKYEGRSQTSLLLKEFLEKKGFVFVDHPAKADIINFHSSGIFDSFKAAKLKKKYGVPVVYSLYSLSKTEPFNHFRNHLAQRYFLRPRKTSFVLSYSAILPLRLRGFRLNELDAVVTPSNFVKERLHNNACLIRIGIDTKKFRPLPRDSLDGGKKLRVGYFGHPSAYKGVLDFARATRLFPKHYESHIHISDTSVKMIRNLKKINPSLQVHGHIEDMAHAYNWMDVIVLPYRSHLAGVANPLVLIEAMACGKAIVTTDFDYLKEIVKGSALIIKPYSPVKIAKAVSIFEDGSIRQRFGERARKIILDEFCQEKMFEDYLSLYRDLTI